MITTLYGENGFGLQAALAHIVDSFVAEHGEMALERVDGEEASYERLAEALTSLPFLASKKLVVLRSPGANKQFTENTEKLLARVPETTDVVVVEPKLDKRSGYYKFLKRSTDFHEFTEPDGHSLARWLTDSAKERGGSLGLADASFLVERVGANQQLLANELEKLLLYNPKITRQTIELLIEPTPQSTIFQLLEAAFAGNARRTLQLYDEQRTLKIEPPQIIAMLAWQLRIFALVSAAGQHSAEEIARDAGMKPYSVQKSQNVVRHLSGTDIKKMVHNLAIIDQRLKREPLDADEALKHYLLTIPSK